MSVLLVPAALLSAPSSLLHVDLSRNHLSGSLPTPPPPSNLVFKELKLAGNSLTGVCAYTHVCVCLGGLEGWWPGWGQPRSHFLF